MQCHTCWRQYARSPHLIVRAPPFQSSIGCNLGRRMTLCWGRWPLHGVCRRAGLSLSTTRVVPARVLIYEAFNYPRPPQYHHHTTLASSQLLFATCATWLHTAAVLCQPLHHDARSSSLFGLQKLLDAASTAREPRHELRVRRVRATCIIPPSEACCHPVSPAAPSSKMWPSDDSRSFRHRVMISRCLINQSQGSLHVFICRNFR